MKFRFKVKTPYLVVAATDQLDNDTSDRLFGVALHDLEIANEKFRDVYSQVKSQRLPFVKQSLGMIDPQMSASEPPSEELFERLFLSTISWLESETGVKSKKLVSLKDKRVFVYQGAMHYKGPFYELTSNDLCAWCVVIYFHDK